MSKKAIRLIACVLAMCIMLAIPVTAGAECSLPDEIYLAQSTGGRCTISSAAMMIRARMYLSNNSQWKEVTESSAASYGWLSGVGLIWNWTYRIGDSEISIGREGVSGISVSELKAILDEHPEGIVLYVSSVPHAVFLTDYEGDTFYCADPSPYYSNKRIPLSESWTAQRVGDQDAVLRNASSYWYVKSYSIPEYTGETEVEPEICDCTEELAGEYICTADTYLNIRSGHSTSSDVIGTIPSGATVNVIKVGEDWAHIEYNTMVGYAYMEFLKDPNAPEEPEEPAPDPRPLGDVTGDMDVSNADMIIISRYVVNLMDASPERLAEIETYGDMNGDATISNADMIIMGMVIVGNEE